MIDNTSTCAYDCFGNEILSGDLVSCVFLKVIGSWKNKHRVVIAKGEVIGWTAKRIDIRIQEITNNTDIQENISELIETSVGDIVRVKPDKICKLGQ
jgi:hypothetical protein